MPISLDDDIRATVDSAIATGDLLHISQEAKRLADAYPESGLDLAGVAELLLKAGVSARVSIELGGLRE